MKAVIVLVVLAVLLAIGSTLAFRVAAVERDLANADEELSTQQYAEAGSSLSHASELLKAVAQYRPDLLHHTNRGSILLSLPRKVAPG